MITRLIGMKRGVLRDVAHGMSVVPIQEHSKHRTQAGEAAHGFELDLLPSFVLRWSLTIAAALTVLYMATTDVVFVDLVGLGEESSGKAVRNLFRLSEEQSLPTWYSVVLLLACAIVLLLIASRQTSGGPVSPRAWLGLGLIFLGMSIDEQIGIHETIGAYLGDVVQTGGPLTYAWVIPGSIFVAVVGVYYLRAFRHLPRAYLVLFFGAGAIYVSGALLAEMFEAVVVSGQEGSAALDVSYLLQDPLEMAGTAIFLYALLRYCVNQLGWHRLTIG
jgi:hypothetical protein